MAESGRSGYGRRLPPVAAAFLAVLALGLLAGCRQQAAAPTVEPDAAPVAFHAQGEPELLSQWQLLHMADGRLQPNAGVLPYELNTPLFTDYAHKLRTLWMPEGVSARYTAQGSFEFPVGTIISKTFYYPRVAGEAAGSPAVLRSDGHEGTLAGGGLALDQVRLVETRLLVRRQEGWVALPYVWNPEQTEARLKRGGELVELDLVNGQGGHAAHMRRCRQIAAARLREARGLVLKHFPPGVKLNPSANGLMFWFQLPPEADAERFHKRCLQEGILVPPGHPLLGLEPQAVTLQALASYPIITYEAGYTGRSHIDESFAQAALAPDVVLTAMDADVIKTYVELGMGVGIVASIAFDAERDRHLRAIDARHLFEVNLTRLGLRRGGWLRGYAFRFIETFVPTLTADTVRQALQERT